MKCSESDWCWVHLGGRSKRVQVKVSDCEDRLIWYLHSRNTVILKTIGLKFLLKLLQINGMGKTFPLRIWLCNWLWNTRDVWSCVSHVIARVKWAQMLRHPVHCSLASLLQKWYRNKSVLPYDPSPGQVSLFSMALLNCADPQTARNLYLCSSWA